MSAMHAALMVLASAPGAAPPDPLPPLPAPEQLAWQDLEYGMFCHFGVNTFHDREWGDGTEDPKSFHPTSFDARQWARVARESGMRYLVVTAKHHDGFCLFPSDYTDHDVASSDWRGGRGDVVRDVAEACREQGLMFGFYLSPWDRHEPAYADNAAYDEFFRNQLRELLTRYGRVGEVWFDGAGGKGHVYNFASYYEVVRELQPNALIAICGPDIRWVGNEEGVAPETLWNVVERDGEPVWHPAECDVPIRNKYWFWRTGTDGSVRSVEEVVDIYYKSVGRGAVLLLNVTPDRRGLLPEPDVAALREAWRIISTTFQDNLAEGRAAVADNVRGDDPAFGPDKALDGNAETYWATDDGVTRATLEVDLGKNVTFDRAMAREHIALGQRVEAYAVEAWDGASWKTLAEGTTVGHKRLDRFDAVTASRVRLVIEKAKACPTIQAFGVYKAPDAK